VLDSINTSLTSQSTKHTHGRQLQCDSVLSVYTALMKANLQFTICESSL